MYLTQSPTIVYGMTVGLSRFAQSLFSLHCFADLVFGPLYVYLCNSEKLQKFVFPPRPSGARVRVARSGSVWYRFLHLIWCVRAVYHCSTSINLLFARRGREGIYLCRGINAAGLGGVGMWSTFSTLRVSWLCGVHVVPGFVSMPACHRVCVYIGRTYPPLF